MAGAIGGARASCVFCDIASKSSSTTLLHSVSLSLTLNLFRFVPFLISIAIEFGNRKMQDDRVVAFQDIRPSAFRHYLVIPVEHIPTVKDLQRKNEDYSLVNHMFQVGRMLLLRDAPQSQQYRFGFHQPPLNSVNHLHLHCLALPYTPRWRFIKYLSFGPIGFIEVERFLEKIKPLPAVHSEG